MAEHVRRPRIAVLATGGTIAASKVQGLDYSAGKLSTNPLLDALPGAEDWIQLSAEQVVNRGSQDIDYPVWVKLAGQVRAAVDNPEIDGVVITHGTDTLEETAYFLSLTINTDMPIVLTGAMRPPHALSPDGPQNLYAALAVAASPLAHARGVLVVMNEQIYAARDVQKVAASGIDAFASPNSGPVGTVHGQSVAFRMAATHCPSADSPFAGRPVPAPCFVPVLYSHADIDVRQVAALLSLGAEGIVLAGVGNGNTSEAVLNGLADAAKQGVIVVRSSRTGSGTVQRNVEVDDDYYGFVAAYELNPQKSRILLQLALSLSRDPKQIQDYFLSH